MFGLAKERNTAEVMKNKDDFNAVYVVYTYVYIGVTLSVI